MCQNTALCGNGLSVAWRTFCLFVWGFTLHRQHFSYLMATAHKSIFPGLFLTSA